MAQGEADPVAQALVVEDAHQAGRVAARQNPPALEQGREPVDHRQGESGTSADVDAFRSRRRGHPLGIDPGAGAGEGLDVRDRRDPVGPAGDGAARAGVAPADGVPAQRPILVVSTVDPGGDRLRRHVKVEPPIGIAAGRVDRPAGCRTIPARADRSMEPLARLNLDAGGGAEVPAGHLSPAVPPAGGTAPPAGRRALVVLVGMWRTCYTHREPR